MKDAVHVLWTGGWDSTYRILQIIYSSDSTVQPHYIVDYERKSTLVELRVIEEIRALLVGEFGEIRLRVPQISLMSSLRFRAEASDKWRRLRQQVKIGEQYCWLAAYAEVNDLENLELCIHRDDKAHALLLGRTAEANVQGFRGHVLKDDVEPDLELFRRFFFPVFDMTKCDMERSAAEMGVENLLRRTWFCFNPILGRYPCGRCNPCLFAFEEGMASRIGWRGLALGIPFALLKRLACRVFRSD